MKILFKNNKYIDDFRMTQKNKAKGVEKWNENIVTCSDCGIQWKKIGKTCPICFAPPEKREEDEVSVTKAI